MKNDLSCDVVRDLLPSYIDELTSDDSNQAIMEHLSRCGECRDYYEAMCLGVENEKKKAEKEVDYLKGVKKKSRKKTIRAIIITSVTVILAFAIIIGAFAFFIGTPVSSLNRPVISQDGDVLTLEFYNPNSAKSYSRLYTSGEKNINVQIFEVISSVFFPSGYFKEQIDVENVDTVSFMGKAIWENGLIISKRAEQLQGRATKYVGSAHEVRAIFEALKMPESFFNISIQSDTQPYGLNLNFEEPLSWEENSLMLKNAKLVLALVDNLGQFSWTYTNPMGQERCTSVSAEEAFSSLPVLFEKYNRENGTDWLLLEDLKAYASSSYNIQQLLNVLDY